MAQPGILFSGISSPGAPADATRRSSISIKIALIGADNRRTVIDAVSGATIAPALIAAWERPRYAAEHRTVISADQIVGVQPNTFQAGRFNPW